MDAKVMGLDNLFDTQVTYRIPQFQRPYAWGIEQWEPLWNDVKRVAERILTSNTDDDLLPHFMGAIVLKNKEITHELRFDEVSQVLVVDGQQRLTTLQLLIKAIQKAFEASIDDIGTALNLNKYIVNDEWRIVNDPLNGVRIRQSNRLDQFEFQEVIGGSINESGPNRGITDAYCSFYKLVYAWLNEDKTNVQDRASALFRALTEYLKIAAISLDVKEKPHFILEILNARGEPLNQGDHIKSTVMYEADVVDDAQKAGRLWGTFEDGWWRHEDARGRVSHPRLDRFLNYWVIVRIGESVTITQTAREFRSYIEKQGRLIDEVAGDIRSAGLVYRNVEENRQPGIETFLKRIKTMEIGVIMPTLLWLYTEEITEKEPQRSVRALESFLVRRMLCNMGTQGLNALFIEMVTNLKNRKDQRADDAVITYLDNRVIENRLWPDNQRVIDSLTSRSMPGNPARKKMVFDDLETHIRPKMAEELGSTEKLTVEHILPQKWDRNGWPFPPQIEDKEEAESTRREFVGLIGNLTLATKGLNSSMSNRSWNDKQKALNDNSSLFLNKSLLAESPTLWDERAIDDRSRELALKIVEIWPHKNDI